VLSDAAGVYSIGGLPPGEAIVQAAAAGFSVDERPVTLKAGERTAGVDLYLYKLPVPKASGSISGAVVETSDGVDGPPWEGVVNLVQGDTLVQTVHAKAGLFVFEDVKARGDLRVVVPTPTAGFMQDPDDGFVPDFDGTSVSHLTVQLKPVPADQSSWIWWLVGGVVLLLLLVGGAIWFVLAQRRRGAA